ncbi:hypothetical protein AV656_03515 [Bhargavaea cecembensis]|uniref:Uncharacterized protein n=1 Tax=Bhargavaea cecembensis TaxID=394098 RepID=A0A163F5N4_9BACL|nr:hypothetical protein AV656_03515 [Bhargavaea cecembensis]
MQLADQIIRRISTAIFKMDLDRYQRVRNDSNGVFSSAGQTGGQEREFVKNGSNSGRNSLVAILGQE